MIIHIFLYFTWEDNTSAIDKHLTSSKPSTCIHVHVIFVKKKCLFLCQEFFFDMGLGRIFD